MADDFTGFNDWADMSAGGADTSVGDFSAMNLDVSASDLAGLLNAAGGVVGNTATMPVAFGGSGQAGGGFQNAGFTQTMGSMPAIVRGLSAPFIAAVGKLASVLGVSRGASPLAYARRVYAMLSSWSAKNPGMSIVGLLVSLGLTVEEAAHFVGWGATHKRRRRSRGISGRDLKCARRTIRKISSMSRMINAACAHIPHRARRRA